MRSALATAFAGVTLVLAACGGTSSPVRFSASSPPLTMSVADRFSVTITGDALETARSTGGADLAALVTQDLLTVHRLLPGPPTTVWVGTDPRTIPETGIAGSANPLNGAVRVSFWPLSAVPFSQTLTFYLARDIAHELDHSVRVLAGAGYGGTLLATMVSEGMAEAFANDAVPGPEVPWDHALSREDEASLWRRAQPLLGSTSSGSLWLFGGAGVPRWTAYTIGFHIVRAYQRRHPLANPAALTRLTPEEVLAGSGYEGMAV